MEPQIMKILCRNRGAADYEELMDIGAGLLDLRGIFNAVFTNGALFPLLEFCGAKRVFAKTPVRLCRARDCDGGCGKLHVCKFYLYGDCRASRSRRGCSYSHDLDSEHNAKVLRENHLQELDTWELCTLLLQNDSTLLPPVCISYNGGSGEFGHCPDQGSCRRLHICNKYLHRTCSGGVECPRAHDFFEPHPMKTLSERGIPNELMVSMFSVYQNIQALKKSGSNVASATPCPGSTEICLYFVKGNCKQAKCRRVHFNMPYRWEVKDSKGWSALTDNEAIERDYCNPAKIYSEGAEPVCFDTMTRGTTLVRRLSTVSSVLLPNFILTTEWAWYWEEEYGNWIQYASIERMHCMSSITSEDLEQRYHEDNNAVVSFTIGQQTYELSFKDMEQRNKNYGTKRKVRRRPVFVSSADAQKARTRNRPNNPGNFKSVPSYWDKTLLSDTEYKMVSLQSSTDEYKKIHDLFMKTMQGYKIYRIERLQNKSLWEVFQWQRDQMKKTNTKKHPVEKLLFHGTDLKHIKAICQQNFDWRICGTHGTAYGKGSYFARDAKYSHSYTSNSATRSMFVCRVLVGEYTKGCSCYVRPPSKDEGDVNFYDSCVDNVKDPSIFVVFEKHQIYPEYLVHYGEGDFSPSVLTVINTAYRLHPVLAVTGVSTSAFFNPVNPTSSASTSTSVTSNPLKPTLSARASNSTTSNPFKPTPWASPSTTVISSPLKPTPSASPYTSVISSPLKPTPSASPSTSVISSPLKPTPSASTSTSVTSNPLKPTLSAHASNSTTSNPFKPTPSASPSTALISSPLKPTPSASPSTSVISNPLKPTPSASPSTSSISSPLKPTPSASPSTAVISSPFKPTPSASPSTSVISSPLKPTPSASPYTSVISSPLKPTPSASPSTSVISSPLKPTPSASTSTSVTSNPLKPTLSAHASNSTTSNPFKPTPSASPSTAVISSPLKPTPSASPSTSVISSPLKPTPSASPSTSVISSPLKPTPSASPSTSSISSPLKPTPSASPSTSVISSPLKPTPSASASSSMFSSPSKPAPFSTASSHQFLSAIETSTPTRVSSQMLNSVKVTPMTGSTSASDDLGQFGFSDDFLDISLNSSSTTYSGSSAHPLSSTYSPNPAKPFLSSANYYPSQSSTSANSSPSGYAGTFTRPSSTILTQTSSASSQSRWLCEPSHLGSTQPAPSTPTRKAATNKDCVLL